MGNALVGHPKDFAQAALSTPDVRNLARGLPVDLLQEGALLAAEAARNLSSTFAHMIVQEACRLALEPEEALLAGALWMRLQRASSIVEEYLDKIRTTSL
ncbi:hypothetical protein F0U60_53880 [Archangium minus]|uniref:Uncharacterized protein n=2 Tax=Archangium minus TaxID=83450 RepID=A0ABY9XCE1_9BACT|nr:hypothetical protein F0U60_53880 [Archangium minus]